jgi:hypothetical protein
MAIRAGNPQWMRLWPFIWVLRWLMAQEDADRWPYSWLLIYPPTNKGNFE